MNNSREFMLTVATIFSPDQIAILEEIYETDLANRDCWERLQTEAWEEAREYRGNTKHNHFEE